MEGSISNGQAVRTETAKGTLCLLLAEVFFIILPIMVLGMVLWNRGLGPMKVLERPEWALSAVILIGQALVKYVMDLIKDQGKKAKASVHATVLVVSGLTVLGLIPSVLVMIFVISADPSIAGGNGPMLSGTTAIPESQPPATAQPPIAEPGSAPPASATINKSASTSFSVPTGLVVTQIMLFFVALLIFFIVGGLWQYPLAEWLRSPKTEPLAG